MTTHHLKTWPEYYEKIVSGEKTFEVRVDDRGFQVGDTLVLEEYDPHTGYTGRSVTRLVPYIYSLGTRIVMSLHKPESVKPEEPPFSEQARSESDQRVYRFVEMLGKLQEFALRSLEKPLWRAADGRVFTAAQMNDAHLRNTVTMLEREDRAADSLFYKAARAELVWRGVKRH